jgi:hypothetical protein
MSEQERIQVGERVRFTAPSGDQIRKFEGEVVHVLPSQVHPDFDRVTIRDAGGMEWSRTMMSVTRLTS